MMSSETPLVLFGYLSESKFTEHFSVKEMFKTNSIDPCANLPSSMEEMLQIHYNLYTLCSTTLEKLRHYMTSRYGKDIPIIVNSGYRCKELNTLVGGATNSRHLFGRAADISFSAQSSFIRSSLCNSASMFLRRMKELNPNMEVINHNSYIHVAI